MASADSGRASQFPGLSHRGRVALAGLETSRLMPGQAEQALGYLRVYLRDPYHRRWDKPDSCGMWECCPDIDEVRAVLRIVAHNLPQRDSRRLRTLLMAMGADSL